MPQAANASGYHPHICGEKLFQLFQFLSFIPSYSFLSIIPCLYISFIKKLFQLFQFLSFIPFLFITFNFSQFLHFFHKKNIPIIPISFIFPSYSLLLIFPSFYISFIKKLFQLFQFLSFSLPIHFFQLFPAYSFLSIIPCLYISCHVISFPQENPEKYRLNSQKHSGSKAYLID